MININLLPKELRPVQRTPLPHVLSLLIMVAALAFIANTYVSLNRELDGVERQLERTKSDLAALEPTIREHEELLKQKELLGRKISAIQEILQDRTIWSEQLHQLATLTPENIWYSRIRVTSRKFMEERPAINRRTGAPEVDPRTGQPKMARVSIDRPVFEISGYAVDDATGLSSTASLATNTSNDAQFAKLFALYTSKIEDTEYNGFPVRTFSFEYLIGS